VHPKEHVKLIQNSPQACANPSQYSQEGHSLPSFHSSFYWQVVRQEESVGMSPFRWWVMQFLGGWFFVCSIKEGKFSVSKELFIGTSQREQQSCISLIYIWFPICTLSYLLEREAVGTTVAMGANPFAVTAEMANSKAELSFIVFCRVILLWMNLLHCQW